MRRQLHYSEQGSEFRRKISFQRGAEERAEDAENEKLNAASEIED